MKKMLRRGEPFARLAADKFIMLMEYRQPDEIRCRTLLFTEKMRAIAAQKLADMPIELYYGVYCLTERDGEEIMQPHLMLEKADAAVRSIKRRRLTHAQEDIPISPFIRRRQRRTMKKPLRWKRIWKKRSKAGSPSSAISPACVWRMVR